VKIRSAVVLSSILALLVWVGVWWVIWAFAGLVPDDLAAKFGQTGDMFGAGSALFSGVAVAAVAVVLIVDQHERRKDLDHRETVINNEKLELRPYVVGHIEERDARIDQSSWVGSQLTVTIVLRVTLNNRTSDPALNVSLVVSDKSAKELSPLSTIALPLALGTEEDSELVISLIGDQAIAALRDIAAGRYSVNLVVRYKSLNGTGWVSEVEYRFEASQAKVKDILPKLLDSESGEKIASGGGLAGGTVYAMRSTAVPGSWSQRVDQ